MSVINDVDSRYKPNSQYLIMTCTAREILFGDRRNCGGLLKNPASQAQQIASLNIR